jgi:hypothetical protein
MTIEKRYMHSLPVRYGGEVQSAFMNIQDMQFDRGISSGLYNPWLLPLRSVSKTIRQLVFRWHFVEATAH